MPNAATACQRLASQEAQLFWWLLLVLSAKVRSPCVVAGSGLPIEDQTIGHRAELSALSIGLYCLSSFFS
eukprot:12220442-Alexandrium_andersonii.AAC.1